MKVGVLKDIKVGEYRVIATPEEMFAWSMGPMMLLNGSHWKFIGIYLVIMAACIIANIVFKWWWLKLPLDRPGVEEIG